MKRNFLLSNKNSEKIEIFFSNKNNRENKMNFEIQEKIIVNNIEFNSIENAEKYILEEIYNNNSLQELLENPEINSKFSNLFNKYRVKNENENIRNSVKEYSNNNPENKNLNLKNLNIQLRNFKFSIVRNNIEWPVYKFTNLKNSEFVIIRYTEKVYNLYKEIINLLKENEIIREMGGNPEKENNILEYLKENYSYSPRENSWKKEEK
jgi:hypothetical protein